MHIFCVKFKILISNEINFIYNLFYGILNYVKYHSFSIEFAFSAAIQNNHSYILFKRITMWKNIFKQKLALHHQTEDKQKIKSIYSIESHYCFICLKCVSFLWFTFFSVVLHVLTFIAVSSENFFSNYIVLKS